MCKIYDEFQEYISKGGFRGVTLPGSGRFDGLFLEILNTSLRGEPKYIDALEHDRLKMNCMLLVLEHLADLYLIQKKYLPGGFTSQGFVGSHPAVP